VASASKTIPAELLLGVDEEPGGAVSRGLAPTGGIRSKRVDAKAGRSVVRGPMSLADDVIATSRIQAQASADTALPIFEFGR
jgi:hypothetical protein